MKSIDKGKGCIVVEGDREKNGAKEERETFDQEPASYGPRIPSTVLSPADSTSTAIPWVLLFMGLSLVYSPGLEYRFSMSPFPPLVPLNVLPFTTTSFSPLSSSPSCCLPAYLPIDPPGPSPKASRLA